MISSMATRHAPTHRTQVTARRIAVTVDRLRRPTLLVLINPDRLFLTRRRRKHFCPGSASSRTTWLSARLKTSQRNPRPCAASLIRSTVSAMLPFTAQDATSSPPATGYSTDTSRCGSAQDPTRDVARSPDPHAERQAVCRPPPGSCPHRQAGTERIRRGAGGSGVSPENDRRCDRGRFAGSLRRSHAQLWRFPGQVDLREGSNGGQVRGAEK